MTNLEIIQSTYAGKNAEEKRKYLGEYSVKNLSWTEARGFPYAGTYIGLDSVVENVFMRLGKEWIDFKFSPEAYVTDEDKVIAIGSYSGTYKQTNKYFEARVAHFWKLKHKKIISFEQFVDSKIVDEATR